VRRHWEETPDAEVNLTPLLDVVFVVLIMFIVIVPILELDKVMLAPGKSANQEVKTVQGDSPVTLHVRHDGTVWLAKRQIGTDRLEEVMAALYRKYPEVTPQLFCDKRAPFGTYQIAKNAVEAAGYEELDVVLEPA
jgi:biopolymer transport protein ExbD